MSNQNASPSERSTQTQTKPGSSWLSQLLLVGMLAILATTGFGAFALVRPKQVTTVDATSALVDATPDNESYHAKLLHRLKTEHGVGSGRWVVNPNEVTHINDAVSYGHTVLQSTTAGQEFTQTVRMQISGTGGAPWDAGYFVPDVNGMKAGDRGLLVVWIRTVSVEEETGKPGKVSIFVENSSTYEKDVYLTVNPNNQWQEYLIPFEAGDSNPRRVGFHLAFQKQVIEYGGLALIDYGQSIPFSDIPHQLNGASIDADTGESVSPTPTQSGS